MSKIVSMIAVEDKQLALNLQLLDAQNNFTSDDLVSYFTATENMAQEGKKVKDINCAIGNQSLALKAKVVEAKEEYDESEEEEEMTSTSDLQVDLAFFAKKWNKNFGKKGSSFSSDKRRTCYNCDEAGHFSDKCPYEKRLDKPKYEKGEKPRLRPNPVNERYNKNKRRDAKALLGVEYVSDEESEDDEKVVGVAGLVLAEPGSLFTYDYTKDYADNSSTPTTSGTCLMARGTKVISPPSLSSILDDDDFNEKNDEDINDTITGLYKVMCSLRGDARAKFEFLMETVASRDETIESLESLIEDEKRRFNLLKQELSDEKNTSFLLKQQIETFELDKVKDMTTLDKSLLMSQELDASKKELEVAHASLTKDLEHLENANKLVNGELMKLKENHDQLRATYDKALGTLKDPIVVENIACASNSTIDQALLVEENKKLKEQLEKERLTHSNKSKVLDGVLAHQKVRAPKQGLGYNPRNAKNGATPFKKINFVQEGHKVDGKAKENVVNGGATRGNPNHKFAGKFNPSYVLCKGTQGDVYAKYVGPRNGYAYRWYSIWVPKDLVANAKGPITQWVPKQKT